MNSKDIIEDGNSLPSGVEDRKDGGIDYNKPTPYMIKILMKIVNMADAEHQLTPFDKNVLEDLMKYGSIAEVARLRHVTSSAINLRVKKQSITSCSRSLFGKILTIRFWNLLRR